MIYISRRLTKTKQRYSNIEHELLAVVFTLERLNYYTAGYRVKVETDHKPLMSIWKKSIASTSTRVQRLLLRLLQYDIDIQYLPGKRNIIADVLSRVSPLPPKAVDIKAINCMLKMNCQLTYQQQRLRWRSFRI